MDIILRKAHALSKALLEAAKKLPIDRTISISIYDDGDPSAAVDAAADRLLTTIRDKEALIEAAFDLRAAIGRANASFIQPLLTEAACLDAIEKVLSPVVEPGHDHEFSSASEPQHAAAKLEALTRASKGETKGYGVSEKLSVRVATADKTKPLADALVRLRRRKRQIADELLTLNTTTQVQVSQTVLGLLERFNLL